MENIDSGAAVENEVKNIIAICLERGADRAEEIPVGKIAFEPELRRLCELGTCGRYGRNYTCPPEIGEIGALIARLRDAKRAVVWQKVYPLEDSFDFEGMMTAQKDHNDRAIAVNAYLREKTPGADGFVVLTAGGCCLCETCGMRGGEPCPYPEKALASLEAYGINVSQICEISGLKYINGKDTVTFFAGVFLF